MIASGLVWKGRADKRSVTRRAGAAGGSGAWRFAYPPYGPPEAIDRQHKWRPTRNRVQL